MSTKPIQILKAIVFLFVITASTIPLSAQHSVAMQWNEVMLDAIRKDFARPTVHARNLFHTSVAMYDAWAAFNETDDTYLLGNTIQGYECPFDGIIIPADVKAAQEEAMSYAVYRIMVHRFQNSPGIAPTYYNIELLMEDLGYNIAITDTNYTTGEPAALGNYIAQHVIRYGMQDGANEADEYENLYYEPRNEPLAPKDPGNPLITDPNHWQPLTLDFFIDQSGNPIPINTPDFLSPEWGNVAGFSLAEDDLTTYVRDSNTYNVYYDPGMPPFLDDPATSEEYKWNFALVSVWASHLDTTDGVMWDISPASIGNVPSLPDDWAGLHDFYDLFEGGDPSIGHTLNPSTGLAYEPQMVPRGDYARILAEFWADGPDSETPPGHWFTILNYVNEHPDLVKKYQGIGDIRDNLEWDVKSYLILGGTMHDAAIAAWGIKGWYDYIRPISAIRHMADNGQCTDSTLSNYSELGIPLYPGYIEVVDSTDELAGDTLEHVGKIKLYSWRGPDYIDSSEIDMAGVGWILAENWWPYQRPTFITPPFAGYVSGHSTYSRAAAEALTLLTGDAFFPVGMGEFEAPKNEFLVFEQGPSRDVTLQWATYRDASDQCSLSRIWGGIHPPVDDVPGRLIGLELGHTAFAKADSYFDVGGSVGIAEQAIRTFDVFPNPIHQDGYARIRLEGSDIPVEVIVFNATGILEYELRNNSVQLVRIPVEQFDAGIHFIQVIDQNGQVYQGKLSVL